MRGLKLDIELHNLKAGVAPHTGAWIETENFKFYEYFYESHPTRVRGLKLLKQCICKFPHQSHPTRVRGLKPYK